jgi:DNA-binding transcriptional LysR family regulator
VLTQILAGFLASRPRLAVELVTEARRLNLLRGEAELALRFARFEQQEIVQRRLGTIRFGLYATAAYMKRAGRPDFADGCRGHAVVAMNEDLAALLDVAWLDDIAGNARVIYRSSSRDAQAAAAAADAGLVCLPIALARDFPALEPLAVPRPPPDRELWLGVHREAHKTSRVRALGEHIAKSLRLP